MEGGRHASAGARDSGIVTVATTSRAGEASLEAELRRLPQVRLAISCYRFRRCDGAKRAAVGQFTEDEPFWTI